MKSRRKIVEELRQLDTRSGDFCAVASRYFWQRVRSHRNYGRFFVFLSTLSWALFFMLPTWNSALSVLPGFLLFGIIGWMVIRGAADAAQVLYDADHASEVESRLLGLAQVARSYRGDPVSTLVLQVANARETTA